LNLPLSASFGIIGISFITIRLGLNNLIDSNDLVDPYGLISLVNSQIVSVGQIGHIGLVGQIGLGISFIGGFIGFVGLGLVSIARLIGLISLGELGIASLAGSSAPSVRRLISLVGFTIRSLAMIAAAAITHGVAIKLASATKITNAAIWYYCAALLWVLLSLIRREGGLWCVWRVFSSLAGLDSVFLNALQNAKQLFHVSLLQMTKYCVMRECDNIHSWISLSGDLAFSYQDGIYGFKFPKRFLEISSRDLTLFSILII
jgi:hypothetical protein